MFFLLNYLQFYLQKPWRFLLKSPNKTLLFLNRFFWIIPLVIKAWLWAISTPLRIINALYYNIWIHGLWRIRDHLGDVFNPKIKGMRHKRGLVYGFFWLFGFPFRMTKYYLIGILQLIEGMIFVAVDTIFPALTMYHGTFGGSHIDISKPGRWLTGSGNYAGSGIYFTMDKDTAKHYANRDSNSTLVCVRVTLGRIKNLSLAPQEIRNAIGKNGDKITNWGKKKGYTTSEWWRESKKWWEYCLLNPRDGKYIRTWRIRILYVHNLETNQKERIWGGRSFWLF